MGHFFADVVNTTAEQVKEWARSYDCILVLTDIVNSGSTAHAVADAFRRISEDTETARKTQHGKPEVKILAVAKMKNSPPDIEASVVINRPYFPPDQASCLLCQLKQPIRKVEQDTWEEGFRYVDPAQLTPLDFWEMVRDCDALLMEKSYTGGKSLMHRVDTAKLVQRYRHWLRNVIAAKYRWRWGSNYPDMLLTVKEEAGLRFAALVGEAFWPHKCRIVGIPRAVLDHGDEPSIELTDELAGCKKVQVRVLLVDDGINFGGTARKLVQFATEHGVNTLGMIVLDSRLKRNRIERLEALAADPDFRIEALYVWPSHPVVTRKLVSD